MQAGLNVKNNKRGMFYKNSPFVKYLKGKEVFLAILIIYRYKKTSFTALMYSRDAFNKLFVRWNRKTFEH